MIWLSHLKFLWKIQIIEVLLSFSMPHSIHLQLLNCSPTEPASKETSYLFYCLIKKKTEKKIRVLCNNKVCKIVSNSKSTAFWNDIEKGI